MSKRKAPQENLNQDISDFLIELANYEKNVSRNIFKSNAYRTAAESIASCEKRITSAEEAAELPGIGKSIKKKIEEFLATGKLRKIENIRNDDSAQAIEELTRVTGIGPAKAQELVKLGIKSLADLQKNKDKLNHHQLLGLKYFKDFEIKIPRAEVEIIEEKIRDAVNSLDPSYIITICGSYRRGKPESGDVDVLLTHPNLLSTNPEKKSLTVSLLNPVVMKLKEISLITDTISQGDVKFMGVCKVDKLHRRLDIRLIPYDQYYCCILYFTGSDLFNKEMRAHARKANFILNEYSIRPLGQTGYPGEPFPVSCEKDIFEYIDFPYKEPSERG